MTFSSKDNQWRLVESETLSLTTVKARELATKHNGLPHSPCERPLQDERVKTLKEIIASGQAIPFSWATVRFDGKRYRMNGQHSSRAISEFEGQLPDGLTFHVDHFEASSREAMANLFRHFDARMSVRSPGDVAGAFQGLVEEVADCDRNKAKDAVDGLAWYRRTIEKVHVPAKDEQYSIFFETGSHGFIRWVAELLGPKTPEMKHKGVVGAMYATFITSETGARDFWRRVAINNESEQSSPAAVLSGELQSSHAETDRKRKLNDWMLYAKSIKAWNAFRAGENVRSLTVNKTKGVPDIAA